MNIFEALLLALSLCVDSLVVSATTSFHSKITYRRGLALALVFGICQGGFPLLGALIGDVARAFIEAVDHWVAFGLLLLVGGKMIVDGIRHKEQDHGRCMCPYRFIWKCDGDCIAYFRINFPI